MTGISGIVLVVFLIYYLLQRKTAPARGKAVVALGSSLYRYSISIPRKDGWAEWKDLARDAPLAEEGADMGGYAACMILPVCLEEEQVPFDTVAAALVGLMGFELAVFDDAAGVAIQRGDATGREWLLDRPPGRENYSYRIQVVQNGRFAVLLAAWILTAHGRRKQHAFRILDRVEFLSDDGLPFILPSGSSGATRHARVCNEIGLAFHRNGDVGRALACFERALSHKPESVYLSNVLNCLARLQRFARAREVLSLHGEQFSQVPDVLAYSAALHQEAGDVEAACEAYARLFEQGHRGEDDLARYAQMLCDADRSDEAVEVVSRFLVGGASPAARQVAASVHSRRQEFDRAVEILRGIRKDYPAHLESGLDLADTLFRMGNAAESMAVCDELISRKNEGGVIFYLKGRAEHVLGRLPEARRSLEIAAARDPSDRGIQALLDHVTGLLGQSSSPATRHPIEAVSLPEGYSLNEDEAGLDTSEYGACYLDCVKVVSITNPLELRQTEYLVLRITGQAGLSIYNTFMFTFDPLIETIYVNELRVQRPDGSEVAGAPENYYVLDERADRMATDRRTYHIPVPGLCLGAIVRLTISRRRARRDGEIPFDLHMFSCRVPAMRASLFIQGDAGKARVETRLAGAAVPATVGEWHTGHVFERPPVFAAEPHMKSPVTHLAVGIVSDAAATWEHLALDYLDRLAVVLSPSEVIERAPKPVSADLPESDRIRGVLRFVHDHLRYTAIEFGARGQVPARVEATFENGYGDCKDHALLALHLLRSAGIRCSLALVNTQNPVFEDAPSLDQFNHMILYVHNDARFVDCTLKGMPLYPPVPAGMGGRLALVLDPEAVRLERIPAHPADSSTIRIRRCWDIAVGDVHESVEMDGYFAGFLRSALHQAPVEARPAIFRDLFANSGIKQAPRLLSVSHLDDLNDSLGLEFAFQAPSLIHRDDTGMMAVPPTPWEMTYLSFPDVPSRRTPFEIPFPVVMQSEIEIRHGEGYHLSTIPAPSEGSTESVRWAFSVTSEREVTRLGFKCHLGATGGTAEEYGQFRAAMERSTEGLRAPLSFVRSDGSR